MSLSSRTFAVALLSAILAFPLTVRAEEAATPAAEPAPAAPAAAEPAAQAAAVPTPMPMMGMRQQMRVMSGDGTIQRCNPRMGMGPGMGMGMGPGMGMGAGNQPPCMTGGKCQMAEALEHRIEAMDKRLDMMQMMLEMLVRQQGATE